MDHAKLVELLASWDGPHFERDREWSDHVLRIAGWMTRENPRMEEGREWYIKGPGCTVAVSSPRRPHPIQNLQDALGQVPFRWYTNSAGQSPDGKTWSWILSNGRLMAQGGAKSAAVACSIAVVLAYQAGGRP